MNTYEGAAEPDSTTDTPTQANLFPTAVATAMKWRDEARRQGMDPCGGVIPVGVPAAQVSTGERGDSIEKRSGEREIPWTPRYPED